MPGKKQIIIRARGVPVDNLDLHKIALIFIELAISMNDDKDSQSTTVSPPHLHSSPLDVSHDRHSVDQEPLS